MIKEAKHEEGEFAARTGHAKGLDINKRAALRTFEQLVSMTGIDGAQH